VIALMPVSIDVAEGPAQRAMPVAPAGTS